MSTETLKRLEVRDVSGQKMFEATDVPADASVGEIVRGLLAQMQLPENDVGGRTLNYQAHLEREGRHLHASEIVGDALKEDDLIVLQPDIDAGAVQA